MRKLCLFVSIVFLVFLLIGCSDSSNNDNSQYSTQDQDISIMPIQFDFESVIRQADDIFIGELIGIRFGENMSDNPISSDDPFNSLKVSPYIEYEFRINQVLYSGYEGRSPSTIYVYFHDYGIIEDDLGYNPMYDCVFYKGYEYLLPVYLTDKPYYKHDVYHIAGDMVLGLEKEIANFSSLSGKNSVKNEDGVDFTKSIDKNQVVSYINKLIQTKQQQNSYTREVDLLKIFDFSHNIFRVKVKELVQTRRNELVFGETYTVEIVEIVKGDEIDTSKLVMVDFVGGLVDSGDIVYVGLDRGISKTGEDGIFFCMSSRILFSESDINLIKQNI